ncbi:unnamed protein product [Mytilus edulis]|uniref:Novel STAND NTPase 3 domain-containing protein n=1 Tax=Mytilus edulis TaxID=6550 RepID=A0A8S3UMU3_MYTED|nr:unnamed protein product [Mytilus edulis]
MRPLLTELHDFTDIVTSDGKLIILFEDVFGRTNTRFTENTDIQIIQRLQACLNQGNVKAILTVRDTIKVSCQRILTLHKIFNGKCEVDLSSVEFKMSRDKKESLLLNYFKKFNLRVISLNEDENYFKEEILKENMSVTLNHKTLYSIIESEPLLGFPEACSLFTRNRKLTRLGIRFFNHPSKHLYDEIDKVRKNGKRNTNDKLLYVTLVYLLLNGDVLDENCVDTAKGMDIMQSCYGSQQERLLSCDIIDAAADMKGRYLTYRPDTFRYHFQHQTVLESVMISYSKIKQEVVISMLSFDFIREMVRLQHYRENEGRSYHESVTNSL